MIVSGSWKGPDASELKTKLWERESMFGQKEKLDAKVSKSRKNRRSSKKRRRDKIRWISPSRENSPTQILANPHKSEPI